MWSKFTSVLKSRPAPEEPQGDVLHKVYEQHPNLSVFHPPASDTKSPAQPSPPPSPSRKRSVLKRLSRQPLKDEGEPSKSASLRMPALPKKSRPQANFNTVGSASQLSLMANPGEPPMPPGLARSNSMDMLSSSQDSPRTSSRSSIDVLRRPSLDLLRNEEPPRSSQDTQRPILTVDPNMPGTPGLNDRMGSVRSILREPNTPGTGQNVRFFSRDAYKLLSPEQSMEQPGEPSFDADSIAPTPPPKDNEPLSFMDALNQTSPPKNTSTPAFTRHSKSNSKTSRPSVADVFSPLMETNASLPDSHSNDIEGSDMSLASPAGRNASNIFDVSQPLDLRFDPPGLDFDVHAPIFDQSMDAESSFDASSDSRAGIALPYERPSKYTSTPPRPKEDEQDDQINLQVPQSLEMIDETIFHAKEVPQRLPTPLHDRSQSFTLGQTVFYSMEHSANAGSAQAYPSNALQESTRSTDSQSSRNSVPPSSKNRTRAISDSMLQNMLRSSPKIARPEEDINGGEEVMIYSPPPAAEPDPFSAHASTYYTPQANIPKTPPKSANHARTTSKEENIIYSLQTQLAFQTELCQQYEADLRARDELVEILGKKLADVEKDETARRGTMRSWKKKMKDLERMCRHMEEELDSSRQMSMERSVMDEASGEALRMLHRQIAALEREKAEQVARENMLKDEMENLEALVKEKSDDVHQLQEMVWNRDQSERELSQGIRDVKAQVDEMGNVSMAYIDEDELRRLREEKENAIQAEESRHRVAEVMWQQERGELLVKLEGLEAKRNAEEEEVERLRQQLRNRDKEYETISSELDAQWGHTENMSSKIEELEKEFLEVKEERDDLARQVNEKQDEIDEYQHRVNELEVDLVEAGERNAHLEDEIEKHAALADALEKDRDQSDDELQQARERIDTMMKDIEELQNSKTNLTLMEKELQYSKEASARLEASNRKRDAEIEQYKNRATSHDREVDSLREEVAGLKREYNRLLDEQSRWSRESSFQGSELQASLENAIKLKAESDVELKTSRDQVAALKDEVERLRRQVHTLQQSSADKEVKLAQVEKQRAQAKQDIEGLNIALSSKQQELDLMKRNMGVRGTAGMTPAQTSKTSHRRDSAVFNSTPISRPSSVASDNGIEGLVSKKPVERKGSAERPGSSASVARPSTALSKSSRINSTAKMGSMGPPPGPVKPRGSISGTPTPTAKPSLGRSGSSKPALSSVVSPTGTPIPQRRVSSAIVALEQRAAASGSSSRPIGRGPSRVTSPVSSVSELEEKENVGESVGMVTSSRRRVLVPS